MALGRVCVICPCLIRTKALTIYLPVRGQDQVQMEFALLMIPMKTHFFFYKDDVTDA